MAFACAGTAEESKGGRGGTMMVDFTAATPSHWRGAVGMTAQPPLAEWIRRGRLARTPQWGGSGPCAMRYGIPCVTAPSPLLDPRCLAALNTGIPFVGPLPATLDSDSDTQLGAPGGRGGECRFPGHGRARERF
eukprot:366141-Chlamydomonas_euryale.AAC.4